MIRYNDLLNRYNDLRNVITFQQTVITVSETVIMVQTGMRVRARAAGTRAAGKRVRVQRFFPKKN
jgi:hypothetical protein